MSLSATSILFPFCVCHKSREITLSNEMTYSEPSGKMGASDWSHIMGNKKSYLVNQKDYVNVLENQMYDLAAVLLNMTTVCLMKINFNNKNIRRLFRYT